MKRFGLCLLLLLTGCEDVAFKERQKIKIEQLEAETKALRLEQTRIRTKIAYERRDSS